MRILASILTLFLAAGCATLSPDVPIEKRLQSAQITLQAVEDVAPELVASGDLTVEDAERLQVAVDRAQEVVGRAQRLAGEGLPKDAISQLGYAIDALRVAVKNIESEKAKQNAGRAIAALVLTKTLMEQEAALR